MNYALTNEHVRLPKLLLYSIMLATVILLGNLGVMLFVTDEQHKLVLIDMTYPLWGLGAAIGLFYAAKRAAVYSHRLALAWGILALASLSAAAGNALWAVYELGQGDVPFPSLADAGYLSSYLLYLCGVLLLPAQRLKPSEWLKTALDMTIVMLAAVLASWRYLLGPTAVGVSEESLLVQLVSLAFPASCLVLLWAALVLLYRGRDEARSGPLLVLTVAFGISIVGESIYSFQSLQGTYVSGGLLDLSWLVASLLIGIAGVWEATRGQPAATQEVSTSISSCLSTWLTYLPYVLAIAVYVMLETSETTEEFSGMTLLSLGVGLTIILVLLRQMVTLNENRLLFAQAQGALAQVQGQAEMLSKTNQDLQVEIGERKRVEEQLAHDAVHDALTGLPNRVLFLDRLRHAIEFAKRHAEYRFSVLFLDLDQFKVVNDSLGHTIGDQLLIAFAQRLRMCLRVSDTVARLGGDEFVILLEDTKDEPEVTSMADRIQAKLEQPFNLDGYQVFTSASIGVVANAMGYERPDEVLRDADIAMYQAKTQGKARSELFSLNMRDQAQKRLELESDLRNALERHEFELHYQPILSLQSDCITGFEALIRWNHPQRGLVPPGEFIPVAEETGLIVPIGQWVLREACRQLREWQMRFPQTPPLTMNVNISGTQFATPDFIAQVQGILHEVGLDPTSLRLELTESVWVNSTTEAVTLFRKLNNMGIQLHIDDFGTGYSSLAYLQYFPIRMLKIDRSFVNKMDGDGNNMDIVRALIAMTHDLGMEAVAEGVETQDQLNNLKALGCNYGQGYLLSRPTSRTGMEQLLTQSRATPATPHHDATVARWAGRRLPETTVVYS